MEAIGEGWQKTVKSQLAHISFLCVLNRKVYIPKYCTLYKIVTDTLSIDVIFRQRQDMW